MKRFPSVYISGIEFIRFSHVKTCQTKKGRALYSLNIIGWLEPFFCNPNKKELYTTYIGMKPEFNSVTEKII